MIRNIKIPFSGKFSMRLENLLLVVAILANFMITVWLIVEHRMPRGQDGFHVCFLQYYFLNNLVHYGELPQWKPYEMHGHLMTFDFSGQFGYLQHLLFFVKDWIKNFNFLPFYHLGMFVKELILLVGSWLLARRFFSSPLTCFFVAMSAVGCVIWLGSPHYNLHIHYSLPLILYFLHQFLDTAKWRYLFLAGNYLGLQSFQGLVYSLPMFTFVIFVYFFSYIIFNFKEVLQLVKQIRVKWWHPFVAVASAAIPIAGFYLILSFGLDEIAVVTFGRSEDGSVGLDTFLTYGGGYGFRKWLLLPFGISPSWVDDSLYVGLLPLALVLIGLFRFRKKGFPHFFLTAVVILLFSVGTLVSIAAYYAWPMMKLFRHIGHTCVFVKILICFLAGFGFDALFFDERFRKRWPLFLAAPVFFWAGRLASSHCLGH